MYKRKINLTNIDFFLNPFKFIKTIIIIMIKFLTIPSLIYLSTKLKYSSSSSVKLPLPTNCSNIGCLPFQLSKNNFKYFNPKCKSEIKNLNQL